MGGVVVTVVSEKLNTKANKNKKKKNQETDHESTGTLSTLPLPPTSSSFVFRNISPPPLSYRVSYNNIHPFVAGTRRKRKK